MRVCGHVCAARARAARVAVGACRGRRCVAGGLHVLSRGKNATNTGMPIAMSSDIVESRTCAGAKRTQGRALSCAGWRCALRAAYEDATQCGGEARAIRLVRDQASQAYPEDSKSHLGDHHGCNDADLHVTEAVWHTVVAM